MRRLFAAFVFALAFTVLVSAPACAASLSWQRIRLSDAGTASIPGSWTVLQVNQSPAKDSYGTGVYSRLCLSAAGDESSVLLLSYWPFSVPKHSEENTAQKFTEDMTSEMMRKYNSSGSRPVYSRVRTGGKAAFISSYRINGTRTAQSTASFFHGGKIYCLIMTYQPSREYNATRLMRQMINRWEF